MFSILLPTILGAILFKRLPNTLKVLTVFVFLTVISEILTYIFYLNGQNNLFLYHIYTFLEFGFISWIYASIFNRKYLKVIIGILSLAFISASALSLIKLESLVEFNSIQRMIELIILVLYFFIHMGMLMKSKKAPFLEMHPYFILTLGFIIYFIGTAILFYFTNLFIEMGNLVSFWMIHGALNIFLNIIYSIVLWRGSEASDYL